MKSKLFLIVIDNACNVILLVSIVVNCAMEISCSLQIAPRGEIQIQTLWTVDLTFGPRVLWQLRGAAPGCRVCWDRPVLVSCARRPAGSSRATSAPASPRPAVCSWRRRPPAAARTARRAPTAASRATSCGRSPPPGHRGAPGWEPCRQQQRSGTSFQKHEEPKTLQRLIPRRWSDSRPLASTLRLALWQQFDAVSWSPSKRFNKITR